MLTRRCSTVFAWCLAFLGVVAAALADPVPPPSNPAVSALGNSGTQVVVIPVREQIARPQLYILRRGLKDAIERKADVVVLDIKTPGGALDVTFDMLEAMNRFPGRTIAFVNNEAMSAGAFISAMADEIWFSPDGIIGAAAPVTALGQDVDKTMRLKVTSYLKARMRAISEGKGYRGQVISAMIDADGELKIGDKVVKEKGELLSLTATEASATYGTPPQPLLAAGIASGVDALLVKKFGAGNYSVRRLEITWSERLAVFMNSISPVLLGLGLLALFIEFKTPGFGVFGITGIVLLGIVFLGNFVAGLSGHEPMLVFALGLLLIAVEVFFFPGIAIMAVAGVLLVLGSLVWSMADLWPQQAPGSLDFAVFVQPLANLALGVCIALGLGLVLARFLPRGWVWDRLILAAAVVGDSQHGAEAALPAAGAPSAPAIGATGVAVTALRPGGVVEIGGRRYEALVAVGAIEPGQPVVVRGRGDFALLVEQAPS